MLALIDNGKAFSVSEWLTFSASQVRYLVFDPTGYVPSPGYAPLVFGFFPAFAAEAGPITIDYHAAPDVSDDGANLLLFNRDANSVIAPQSTFKIDPLTVTDPGTKFAGDLVPASSAGGGISGPARSEDELPFILNPAVKVLIKMQNLNGNDTQVSIKFTIAEL